jgi:hypothetical protein
MESTAKPTSDWRSRIKVHPAADLFPMMSPEELRELGEDIKANGAKTQIATWVDAAGTEWLMRSSVIRPTLLHRVTRRGGRGLFKSAPGDRFEWWLLFGGLHFGRATVL